jgi:hypothetical protein
MPRVGRITSFIRSKEMGRKSYVGNLGYGVTDSDPMIYYGLPTRFSNAIEDILMKKIAELAKRVQP